MQRSASARSRCASCRALSLLEHLEPYAVRERHEAGKLSKAPRRSSSSAATADPDDIDTRLEPGRGRTTSSRARRSTTANRTEYVDYLRKAQAEILAAARIEPTSPRPHTWLGIITAYEGDLNGSETRVPQRAAAGAWQRPPGARAAPTTRTWHTSRCTRAISRSARRYLDKGAKTGAPQDEIDRISVLLAWKANDMVEARDIFNGAVAPVAEPSPTPGTARRCRKQMETFDDFAAVCCKNPTCGPYMEDACKRASARPSRAASSTLEHAAEQRKLEVERQQKLQARSTSGKGRRDHGREDRSRRRRRPRAGAAPKRTAPAPKPRLRRRTSSARRAPTSPPACTISPSRVTSAPLRDLVGEVELRARPSSTGAARKFWKLRDSIWLACSGTVARHVQRAEHAHAARASIVSPGCVARSSRPGRPRGRRPPSPAASPRPALREQHRRAPRRARARSRSPRRRRRCASPSTSRWRACCSGVSSVA